ncbi:PIN domain-containing protein [Thauera butanivorans]|uniref:PIN domain-containing protein n=1 Tax=Thauera butanivorans TaxID=86174 RepID=UPI000838F497|nr:PIN domain-containing protein [Thauera butanivorans]
MKYLLDANVLSELVRPRPDAVLAAAARTHEAACATSSVVYLELWSGVALLGDTARGRYLRDGYGQMFKGGGLPVLPFDAEAAYWLACERARLAAIGRPPPLLDAQIAATAATRKLTLVTRNTRDFECFRGLQLENWFEAEKS